jgi:hypothetical protein
MRHNRCVFWLMLVLMAGCASPPRSSLTRVGRSIPEEALITQRGVLTARGRQFPLNGYLALSATNGMRLILTENFGNVLADVLVKPDHTVRVMRSSRALRPAWIRNYVAADLICLFGDPPGADCPGRMISPSHFVIQRRWYQLDVQTIEIKPGLQSPDLFKEPAQTP